MPCDIFKIKKGDRLVLAFPENGYDYQKQEAQKIIDEHGAYPVFTLKAKEVGNWSTALYFEEIPGSWNSVQFAEEGQPTMKMLSDDKPVLKKFKLVKETTRTDFTIVEAEDEDAAYDKLWEDSDELEWQTDELGFSSDYSVEEL